MAFIVLLVVRLEGGLRVALGGLARADVLAAGAFGAVAVVQSVVDFRYKVERAFVQKAYTHY